eukprot:12991900-Alexandrium_andersonii.AAC.1
MASLQASAGAACSALSSGSPCPAIAKHYCAAPCGRLAWRTLLSLPSRACGNRMGCARLASSATGCAGAWQ